MPRQSRGPHLAPDPERGTWTIVDGKRKKRTGVPLANRERADAALEAYLGKKHQIVDGPAPSVSAVLICYGAEHAPTELDPRRELRLLHVADGDDDGAHPLEAPRFDRFR